MTAARLVVVLVLLSGCAAARVRSPAGVEVTASAVGKARVLVVYEGGTIAHDSAGGAFVRGPGVVIEGGALSPAIVDALATFGSIVAACVTTGVCW